MVENVDGACLSKTAMMLEHVPSTSVILGVKVCSNPKPLLQTLVNKSDACRCSMHYQCTAHKRPILIY